MTRHSVLVPLLTTLVTLLPSSQANSFGNSFSVGPTSSGITIINATSTLILPNAPNPIVNDLSLWTGMGMSNGDLIQALADSYPADQTSASSCDSNSVGDGWCIAASVLKNGADGQTVSSGVVASPGDHVTMRYTYNSGTDSWDQYAYVNGNLVSTLTSSQGAQAPGFGTAEECQPGTPCGVVPEHQWINTVLVLSAADPDFGSTVGLNGATGSLTTSDGGVTWTVDTITIDEYDFTTGQ